MIDLKNIPIDATYDIVDSPVGALTIITSAQGLHAILWHHEKVTDSLTRLSTEKTIVKTKQQLTEYFAGKRKTFDLPLILAGTDFQLHVWQQLLKIPYGQTISYGEQAKRMGDKNKARAVGMANGQNLISIVVPCHRVIGANGTLTGFGGGLDKKEFLLTLEKSGSEYGSP